jgi:phosphohistidine phosphatase
VKHLILLRHAKSSWKDLSLSDHDRPLNKRGKIAAPLIGKRLANKTIQPDLIISSTAKRAIITAKKVAEEISYRKSHIQQTRRLFHATANEILKFASQCDDDTSHLMLVAHNPSLTILANQLLDNNDYYFDNIPTAGMVTIALDITQWQDILTQPLKTELLDYDYPKLIS